jgi:hypothetical protein
MKNRAIATLFLVAIGVTGCAMPPPNPATQAKLDEIQRTVPVCSNERECNEKWEVAQLWVVKNAGYKIQTATNVLIQTYNPSNSRVEIAVQVTKEPLGGGRYQFIAKAWCDNMFGCSLNRFDAVLSFNRAVNVVQS